MSIYTTPTSQLNTSHLEQLLQDGAVENLRLEFKLEVPEKDEVLKKISSFANTYGGIIAVGVRASSKDGRVAALPGVDGVPGFKQKIVDWCFNGINPPVIVDVSDPIAVPSNPGRVIYVIKTPESELAPHFLNGRNGVWIRTNEFSSRFAAQLANESELRHLINRRELVLGRRKSLLERARARYGALADTTKTDPEESRGELGARLELAIVPRFPATPLCKQEELKPLIQRNTLIWRQVRFPRGESGVITQHESAIVLRATDEAYSIFEANVWGMLFYGTRIDENLGYLLTGEPDPKETTGIHIYQFTGYVLAFIHHARKILADLGYSGPLYIRTMLTSVRHIEWLDFPDRVPSRQNGSELDSEVEFEMSSGSDDLSESPNEVVKDLLRHVLFSVNAAEQAETPEKLTQLVKQGYDYNVWRVQGP